MTAAPRMSAKEWKNLRARRLVGPKLNGAPVPCVDCDRPFVRQRGNGTRCYKCGQAYNTRVQNERRRARARVEEAEQELAAWIEQERAAFEAMDPFKRASYEMSLREAVADLRDAEREEAGQYEVDFMPDEPSGDRIQDKNKAKIDAAFGPEASMLDAPLKHALTPDGPDEGYSTYFLPKTEDGYLETDVDWEWRTEEQAKWWRDNPHAFADL